MLWLFSLLFVAFSQTPGCGKDIPSGLPVGELKTRTITVDDYKSVTRTYGINIPNAYDINTPSPFLIYYHGWGSNWRKEALELHYNSLAEENGLIAVYLKGMDDYSGFGRWTSFNTGFSGDETVCTSQASAYQYDSCVELDLMGKCNCFTCYDDILATQVLVDYLKNEFCIDESRMLATGESNGGMFTYYLMQKLPELFSEFMPVFGLPLSGYLDFPLELKTKNIFHYHGKYDTEIPPTGGESDDHWLYESLDDTLHEIAIIQECDLESLEPMNTPFMGKSGVGEAVIECYHFTKDCKGKLAYCYYDGGHYTWPLEHMAELGFWYFGYTDSGNQTITAHEAIVS